MLYKDWMGTSYLVVGIILKLYTLSNLGFL